MHAEVINTGVGFTLDYLVLAVSNIDTYQLRVFGGLGKSAIGEPVYTVLANGKKAVLGMLVGFQSNDENVGELDAWVLPAESIT